MGEKSIVHDHYKFPVYQFKFSTAWNFATMIQTNFKYRSIKLI